MNPLALVPLPYRILAVALLIVAAAGFGWIKGIDHQQLIDDAAVAKQMRAVDAANAAQRPPAPTRRERGAGAFR